VVHTARSELIVVQVDTSGWSTRRGYETIYSGLNQVKVRSSGPWVDRVAFLINNKNTGNNNGVLIRVIHDCVLCNVAAGIAGIFTVFSSFVFSVGVVNFFGSDLTGLKYVL